MAWIETVPVAEADGVLKEAYDWQAQRLGAPTEFTMLGSLYPDLVMERLRLYKVVEECPSGLDPVERQMAALVASALNGTTHCASGLVLKLSVLGVDDALVEAVYGDPAVARTGRPRLDAILDHAAKLTVRPAEVSEDDLDALRAHGLSDLDLLDLNNLVAYYCYINRVANGLGLRTPVATLDEATRALPA